MAIVFRERTGGSEPNCRFGVDASDVTRTYVLYDDNEEKGGIPKRVPRESLTAQIRAILGTTLPGVAPGAVGAPGGAGSLQRVQPMSDPVFPSLFAEDVAVSPPSGENYEYVVAGDPGLAIKPLEPHYAAYQGYHLAIRLTGRPYALVPNERMTIDTIMFQGFFGGNFTLYAYPEWKRNLFYSTRAMDTRVAGSQANAMKFRAPGAPSGADNTMVPAIPDMQYPDSMLSMIWYAVPRRYLDSPNSYLLKYKGTINYRDFWKWTKGSLLYLGVETIRTYVPPQFDLTGDPDPALAGSFAADALCDLSLSFIHTTRATDFPPPITELPYGSWLATGHNLFGHLPTRRFYYANGTGTLPTDRPPTYFAVPHEILFQDPDALNLAAT